jgi:hypothetical protein
MASETDWATVNNHKDATRSMTRSLPHSGERTDVTIVETKQLLVTLKIEV